MSPKNENNIDNVRHSLAHVLATAVLRKWPEAKLGIGPAIEDGFYYDFLFPEGSGPGEKDLKFLEREMEKIVKEGWSFSGAEIKEGEAKKIFGDQPFKLELIDDLLREGEKLTVYTACPPEKKADLSKVRGQISGGCFVDLCRGGHVESTKEISTDAFKLTRIAGAYWRGDEKNKMLTRIYGIAFESKKELDEYIKIIEEAKKRDHKVLGKKMGLFVNSPIVGPGLPLWTPRGKAVLDEIKNFSRELRTEAGYGEVQTPQINRGELFKISGHYDKFKSDMFLASSNYAKDEYFLKPMNCPQHTQIYASEARSYRDLPIKYSDFAPLYRDEKPGELSGLTRLRAFSQDDGHSFCREDQLEEEFLLALRAVKKALEKYDLDYYIRLSLRDKENKGNYLGEDAIWEKSQTILKDLLDGQKVDYVVAEGEAAFYGPKMDFIARDSMRREWQISTIQLDFNMPKRFGLEYTGKDGKKHTPMMIHSALVGSPERFFGILIEHYAGNFPLWLSPVQVAIIPVSESHSEYALEIKDVFKDKTRCDIFIADETLGKRIRQAEKERIPYILVVGDKEKENRTVAVRERGKGDSGTREINEVLKEVLIKIKDKN